MVQTLRVLSTESFQETILKIQFMKGGKYTHSNGKKDQQPRVKPLRRFIEISPVNLRRNSTSELKSSIIRGPQHVSDDACYTYQSSGMCVAIGRRGHDGPSDRNGPVSSSIEKIMRSTTNTERVNFLLDDSGMVNPFSTVEFGLYCELGMKILLGRLHVIVLQVPQRWTDTSTWCWGPVTLFGE